VPSTKNLEPFSERLRASLILAASISTSAQQYVGTPQIQSLLGVMDQISAAGVSAQRAAQQQVALAAARFNGVTVDHAIASSRRARPFADMPGGHVYGQTGGVVIVILTGRMRVPSYCPRPHRLPMARNPHKAGEPSRFP